MANQTFEESERESCVSEQNAGLYQEYYEALKKVRDIIEQQKAKLQQRWPGGSGKKRASKNNDDKIMLLREAKKLEAVLKLLGGEIEAGESDCQIQNEGEENEEIREARELLIDGLKGIESPNPIGVKRMGDVDCKPFYEAMKKESKMEDVLTHALNKCETWNKHVRDPRWHPFKVIKVEGKSVEIVNDGDKKLKALKREMGERVYNAVTTALTEMIKYNPSNRRPVSELWNFKEGRKATLKEGIECVLNRSGQRKRKRLLP